MRRVGPYEVTGELGRGGMGVVLAAVEPATGREVALKVLRVDDARARARLAREAEALARLRHPGIVAVLSAGEDGGRLWVAIERVRGRSLEARLQAGGPLPSAEVARLGLALAEALAHAHARGVLHRDLKPDNVLLPDDGGPPRLVDFGLAALADAAGERLTQSGTFLGTPGYWSPEQASGERARVGPATDVYGLGALLYAALTGQPPITGESLQEVLVATAVRAPVAPSALRAGVDARLERVVLRCLAKRPEDRFAGAAEVAAALAGRDDAPRPRLGPRLLGLGAAAAAVVAGLALAAPDPTPAAAPPPPAASPPPPAPAPAPAPIERPAGPPATVEELPPRQAGLPPWANEGVLLRFVGPDALEDPDSVMLSELLFEATERDPLYVASTLRWVAESARDPRGRARAWHDLARLFQVGRGVARSAPEALRCHRAAAALGHGGSAAALGTALIIDEPEAALGWLRRALAAEFGAKPEELDRARVDVGQLWYRHPDLVPDDELEACLRGATAPQAAVFLSLWLERRGQPDEAARVLDEAVARTDDPGVHAQRVLSVAPRRPERHAELLRGPRAPAARARFATDLFARAGDDSGLRDRAVELLRALFEDPEPEARGIAAAGLVVVHAVDRRNGRRPPRVSEDEARVAYPVARATGHSVGGAAEELGLVSPPPPDGPAPGSTPRAR